MKRKPTRRKPTPKRQPVGLSILAVATELGISRDTMTRKLDASGWKGATLRWRDVVRALVGDKAASLARKAAADADLAELELEEKRNSLTPTQDVMGWINATFSVVQEKLRSLPAVMAARCNPTDPRHSQAQLDEWVADTIRHIRVRGCEELEERVEK